MYYLDNAATTPLHPEVIDEMVNFLKSEYGNPSSKYYPQALTANQRLIESRKEIASLLNCDPEYVIFTSGATESNNFILKGIAEKYKTKGKHIITTKIEHKSIIEICKHLEKMGSRITYLGIDSKGHIDLEELKSAIDEDTILVSIMWGNNEIGVVNEVEKIAKICHDNDVLFHTDATQVIGKVDVDLKRVKVDFLSLSAHKIHGPKGIGAVYVGPDELGLRMRLPSLIDGGSQEYKMRAGTHSMHNIVGFAKACSLAKMNLKETRSNLAKLEEEFKNQLLKVRGDITFNGDQVNKIPGLISVTIPGINNELLCKQISEEIAMSTGSACSIGEKSYVLEELKIDNPTGTIRISLPSDLEDISEVIALLSKYIKVKEM